MFDWRGGILEFPNLQLMKALSKLEKERESKKKAGTLIEKIDAMGQDSETLAAKHVIEEGKQREKQEQKVIDDVLEKLTDSRKKTNHYQESLVREAQRQMAGYDLPRGFAWQAYSTEKGIALYFQAPNRKYYGRGTKISTNPTLDIQAITNLIHKALDHIDSIVEGGTTTPGGIIIPT